ncbi:GAF domain-containing protein [Pseudomonas cremoricolorata]|uniref:GAF domain-containing protein n=1 Tax=Pseudomonas cremoricolorata TaxID=157783 RepID=UPI0004190B51|nr:GAF domain-containing protein [Pseudomonas cremoricolorata]
MRAFVQHFSDRALQVMACGAPVEPLLADFILALQTEIPDAQIGVLVLDTAGNTFRHAIFPGLPASFTDKLVGNPISPDRGSCGRAVTSGKPVEVPDVASDERFADEWKALFHQHGLTSLISVPAIASDGHVQGSIAVVHPFGQPPNAEQRSFLEGAATLCAVICRYSRTQQSQTLLIGELEHRMRNLFSTLSGVAILTLRSHPEPDQFRRVLDQRVLMMQRAHALALAPAEMPLSTLVDEVLSPYRDGYRIQCSGPDIMLAGEAAAALAMVVHELGTNAAKYGALSQEGGELHIEWSTTHSDDHGPAFSLNWQERNGPAVSAPARKGYGTVMVNGALRNAFNGAAAFAYEQAGFSCVISAPFSERLGRTAAQDATMAALQQGLHSADPRTSASRAYPGASAE